MQLVLVSVVRLNLLALERGEAPGAGTSSRTHPKVEGSKGLLAGLCISHKDESRKMS